MDIEQEIEKIKHELTVTIPEELEVAMNSGDLRENSEFSEIISRQYFLNLRLNQLTTRLNSCKKIDIGKISKHEIGVGSIVILENVLDKTIKTVNIVASELTSNFCNEWEEVTLKSPLGSTLVGKISGDTIQVYTPSGKGMYKILSFKTIHENLT
jgi:transcription elongation factor GreA